LYITSRHNKLKLAWLNTWLLPGIKPGKFKLIMPTILKLKHNPYFGQSTGAAQMSNDEQPTDKKSRRNNYYVLQLCYGGTVHKSWHLQMGVYQTAMSFDL